MNRTYFKATMREISQSMGKFVSIVLIILLGSLLYVGIRSVGPDLNQTANHYFKQQKLSDVKVSSTMGLTNRDLTSIKQNKQVKTALPIHMVTLQKSRSQIVSVYGYQKQAKLDQLKLVSGKLPTQANQLVLDIKAKENGYHIGDIYRLPKNSNLNRRKFKIVGFVNSPQYVSSTDRGTTNLGNGTVNYFAYVPNSTFKQKVYPTIAVQFKKSSQYAAGTDSYNNYIDKQKTSLKKSLSKRPEQRQTQLQNSAQAKLNKQKAKIKQQEKQLTKIPSGYQTTKTKAAKRKLTTAKAEIKRAEAQIKKIARPTYLYNDRSANPGYQDYFDESHSIAAIAIIFPGFFLFIAILITFTTVSRMVEKNRREIGLMRALGYTKHEIAMKYIVYTLLAGILGAGLGGVLGMLTLPQFVFSLLSNNNLTAFVGVIPWSYLAQTMIAGLVATLGSALIVLTINLREVPTNLMRERAPKAGKRILMERITPLWRRLSFNQKVSYRNLFRYKGRMLMTIVGIAGCTGLILTGFGIQNSVDDLVPTQYEDVQHFQALVTVKKATQRIHAANISGQKSVMAKSITARPTHGTANDTVTLIVPKATANFSQYVTLKSVTTGKKIKLSDQGVVLSEKLATDMNAKRGSLVTLQISGKKVKAKVTGVTKNYAGHWIYTTKSYYHHLTGNSAKATTRLVKTNQTKKAQREKLSRQLLKENGVLNVSFPRYAASALSTGGLGSVVLIMIVMSGALALVVLYNLTNINISERMRELATIKVLGFYDREVTAYVARENVVFTVAGIILGWGIGLFLHQFIMVKAQTGSILFPMTIHYPGYIWSAVITGCFSLFIGVLTHYKLKRIDMLDALAASE
ncbi:FtsX-like permease family protein [Pediococcus ethanolidurans]|nr:FtsX-like permease family protein [Pediococcus ethanolidurans]GEN94522.1 ABC transporter permease [Pediococcus ethanolidurans]SER28389.1 putative ABC transport system permease protein [Pediococcus ethanolidurans]